MVEFRIHEGCVAFAWIGDAELGLIDEFFLCSVEHLVTGTSRLKIEAGEELRCS